MENKMNATTHPKKTNELDPSIKTFLEGFSRIFASIGHLPIAAQRKTIKEMFCIPEDQLEPVASVKDQVISGRHGPIKIRLFSPKKESPLPVIVFFHRGGWVYGSIEESEMICRKLANASGAIVAAVDYRLSPEYKFPVPLEDCVDAAKWVSENAISFSGNPGKIILAGESAGGNLAAAAALMIRDENLIKIAGQLLLYPVLTCDLNEKHYRESPDKWLLSFQNMRFFLDSYLPSPQEGENKYASPLKNNKLSHLPPCLIITAEHDPLKHEGAAYGKALQKAGVKVQMTCYPGVIHGFLDLPLSDAIKNNAIRDIGAWVRALWP